MPRQCRVVHQNSVISYDAVMTNMNVRHQQITIADRRQRSILHGPAVNRHVFSDDVVVTDVKLGRFVTVFEIGRRLSHR